MSSQKLIFLSFCLVLGFALIDGTRLTRDAAQQIASKTKNFRENCFPKASGQGCTCKVGAKGDETIQFDTDEKCRKPVELQTAENKKALNKEFENKFGGLKENCFPRPGGGCRCVEKDTHGNEIEQRYSADRDCKVPRNRREMVGPRDPVREQAQRNYAAVVAELKDKFKGLKEGCYPRPKGCFCVIGKDTEGRDITERRMKDQDCKCQPGDRSKGCPQGGA